MNVRMHTIVLVWFSIFGPSAARAQLPEVELSNPQGALETINNGSELTGATFDFVEQKLEFGVDDSNSEQEAPITLRLIPWAIQPGIPYRIKVEKNDIGQVVLSNPRLELRAKWDAEANNFPNNSHFSRLRDVIDRIPEDALWVPDEMRGDLERASVDAVINTPADDRTRGAVVEFYYLQQKSYRGNKHIPFSTFDQARQTCLAACGIQRRGRPHPHGSGVLIGENLVLTCKHNLEGTNSPATCEVLFHFTDKDKGAVFKIDSEYHSSAALDYSLLVLGDKIRAADDPAFNLPSPPKLGIEPELEQNSGIYVAGHPGGRPLSVAINSQVVFPFRLEDEASLTHLIGWALLRMFDSATEYNEHAHTYEPKVKDFFTTNYRPAGPNGFYFRPSDRPTIGADPDTKHGNSGGPAFDIERNALIGLLREGAPDDANFPAGANYANFEAIIPISQIVADLDHHKPGWKEQFGVAYFGN